MEVLTVMEEPRMVIQDDVEPEADTMPRSRGATREPAQVHERPDKECLTQRADTRAVPQTCPYLAGRPPCGTHHLFPSGTNVCWADRGDSKPYRTVSRDTQAAYCFNGSEGLRG